MEDRGTTLWALAKDNYDSASDASGKDAIDRVDTAQTLALWGNVLVVSGGVITAAGLTWGIVVVSTSKEQVRLGFAPNGVAAAGRF